MNNKIENKTMKLISYSIFFLLAFMASSISAGELVSPQDKPSPLARIVLDVVQEKTARLVALEQLEIVAKKGDAYAQYVVGSLYRLGHKHPAKLTQADIEKAKTLLSNSAVRGELNAMAGMAEILLSEGDAREAIVWAQALNHYQHTEAKIVGREIFGDRAYVASLLQRCIDRLGRDKELLASVDSDVADFVRQHDKRIREHIAAGHRMPTRLFRTSDARKITLTIPPRRSSGIGSEPGKAIYLAGVNASGGIAKLLIIDSLPNDTFASAMFATVHRTRFNADPEAKDLRWAILPYEFDSQTIRLAKDRN